MIEKNPSDFEEEPADFKETTTDIEEDSTSIVKIEDMSLAETQLAEQLYYSAGLDPIVDAGIKDYTKKVQKEDKLINKVFGIRESDIRGYGESVARRVAFAVYGLLNKQYGGKVGDMRSYVMSLEDDRDHANLRYDELMGRVIGILGDEYKELRTDSKEFIEKLTQTLGDDLKDAKIDQKALAERLADIDGLRTQIFSFNKEKEQTEEKHDAKIVELKSDYETELNSLKSQIDTLNKKIVQEKEKHEAQLTELKNDHKNEIRNLQSQIDIISKGMLQEKDKYETQISELKSNHKDEVKSLKSEISNLNKETTQEKGNFEAQIAELDSEKTTLTSNLVQLREHHNHLKTVITTLTEVIPHEEIGGKIGEALHEFLLKDSKIPDMVIEGVGKFIDFRKYLGMAAKEGAELAGKHAEETLRDAFRE